VDGNIIASFGSYVKPSAKGYNTKVYIFIMSVTDVMERWAEDSERKRKWFDLDTVIDSPDTIFKRPELINIWEKLINCAQLDVHRGSTKRSLMHAFEQIQELFDIRKIPVSMMSMNASKPTS